MSDFRLRRFAFGIILIISAYSTHSLMMGVTDELMGLSRIDACYQFPYITHFGCVEFWHAWEPTFVILYFTPALVGIGVAFAVWEICTWRFQVLHK